MMKMSTLLAAMLFASASVAYAADTSGKPTQPAAQGAASVENQLTSPTGAAAKSGGHATKGLTTAEKNITAKHGKASKANGMEEKAEHAAKPDRPEKLERPAR